jgi:hypothetical protein
MSPAGLPHSDTLESQLGCQLLEDYRRLLRPSSAPGAKASTVCPYKLATQQTNSTRHTHPHTPHTTRGPHRQAHATETTDARVHYTVLKQRTDTNQYPGTHPHQAPTRPRNTPQPTRDVTHTSSHPRKAVYRPAGPPETTPTPHPTRGRRATCSLRTQQCATNHHDNPAAPSHQNPDIPEEPWHTRTLAY